MLHVARGRGGRGDQPIRFASVLYPANHMAMTDVKSIGETGCVALRFWVRQCLRVQIPITTAERSLCSKGGLPTQVQQVRKDQAWLLEWYIRELLQEDQQVMLEAERVALSLRERLPSAVGVWGLVVGLKLCARDCAPYLEHL